jgi:hypothetical protein
MGAIRSSSGAPEAVHLRRVKTTGSAVRSPDQTGTSPSSMGSGSSTTALLGSRAFSPRRIRAFWPRRAQEHGRSLVRPGYAWHREPLVVGGHERSVSANENAGHTPSTVLTTAAGPARDRVRAPPPAPTNRLTDQRVPAAADRRHVAEHRLGGRHRAAAGVPAAECPPGRRD